MCDRCGIDVGCLARMMLSPFFRYRGVFSNTSALHDMSLYISEYVIEVVVNKTTSTHRWIQRGCHHSTHTDATLTSHRCGHCGMVSNRAVHIADIDVHARRCSATLSTSTWTSMCTRAVVQPRRPHRCSHAPLFSSAAIDVYALCCSATSSTSPASPSTSMCEAAAYGFSHFFFLNVHCFARKV